ncbi:hypothetical protein EDB85DRAFT_1888852 [Lactarius pseudohatsudake]|nr:hypothetical protein EDB85DRAFT_1888852 [Lactarius pseudohatsudake]
MRPPPPLPPFLTLTGHASVGPHGTTPSPAPDPKGSALPFGHLPHMRSEEARDRPPCPSFTHEQDTRTWDKPPPLQLLLPFAHKGGWGTGMRCTGQDAGQRGTRHAPPPSPSCWGPARNARGSAAPLSPVCAQRPHANEGSMHGVESERAPHTLCTLPLFACTGHTQTWACTPGWSAPVGSRARAMCEPNMKAPNMNGWTHGSAPPPPVHAPSTKCEWVAMWNPPPFPTCSRAREKREQATAQKPPLSHGFVRKGEMQPHGGSAPFYLCGGMQVGWGSTCMCAAPVRKAEEHCLPGS